jgi:hypothetical protein
MAMANEVRIPAVFVLREGMREQICGKIIQHGKRPVFFHVQRGYFHHTKTNCPYPVDAHVLRWLRAWGIETVYHYEGPKINEQGVEVVMHGRRSRRTLWKANVDDIAHAPQADPHDAGFSQRFRHFLWIEDHPSGGGWKGISPVVEMQAGGDYQYLLQTDDGPRLVLVAPGFNRCAKVEIDQAPLF